MSAMTQLFSVAQVSKPAVSPTSSRQTGAASEICGLETRDTAGLETCATLNNSFSGDKDAPFELERPAEKDCAAIRNEPSSVAKARRLRPRVSAVGFLAARVLWLLATPFVQGLKEGQLCEAVLFTLRRPAMKARAITSSYRRRQGAQSSALPAWFTRG
jgi:hypothetical protein